MKHCVDWPLGTHGNYTRHAQKIYTRKRCLQFIDIWRRKCFIILTAEMALTTQSEGMSGRSMAKVMQLNAIQSRMK